MITITIRTDNEAFADDARKLEVARILRRLADDIENEATPENLRDHNGNHVGNVILTGKDRSLVIRDGRGLVLTPVPAAPPAYRANFGDGTHTKSYPDIRDAKLAIWGRAAIVQYRSFVEVSTPTGWQVAIPSRAQRNGPPIVERTEDRK